MAQEFTHNTGGPWGDERLPMPTVPAPASVAFGTNIPTDTLVPFNDASVAELSPAIQMQTDRRAALADAPETSALDGISAGVYTWDTAGLWRRLTRPDFSGPENIDKHDFLQNIPMVLDEDERKYMMEAHASKEGMAYALQQVKDLRKAREVAGDHEVVGTLTQFVDPVWLAVPPALRVGKAGGAAGRTISAAGSAAIAGGITAYKEGPVSDSDIVTNMLINGALGAALFRPGKGVEVDRAMPDAELRAAAAPRKVQRLVTPEVWEDVPVTTRERVLVSPEVWVDELVPGTPAVTREIDVPPPGIIGSSKPKYAFQHRQFNLTFENPLDKAAYIVAGKGKSRSHGDFVRWGESLGVSESELVRRGAAIRDNLKAQAKTTRGYELNVQAGDLPYTPSRRVEEVTPATPDSTVRRLQSKARYRDQDVTRTERRKVSEAVYEEIEEAATPDQVVRAVDSALERQSKSAGIAKRVMWNMHKTMSSYGEAGKRIANLLYDDNTNLRRTSVEADREAIMSDLRGVQLKYEDGLRAAMAQDGFGIASTVNPLTSRAAYAHQLRLEREVQLEMFRREQMENKGREITYEGVNPRIKALADHLDELYAKSLNEMKKAGVQGSETLQTRAGYTPRRWSSQQIEEVIQKLERTGLDNVAAKAKVIDLVALSLRHAGMNPTSARSASAEVINRALRKGFYEDSPMNAPSGSGVVGEVRDKLSKTNLDRQQTEDILDSLRAETDERSKAGYLKHRVDLDYRATMKVGAEDISIMDLIDSRILTRTDQYVQQVSTNSALARKGLRTRSDVDNLRAELLHDSPSGAQRDEARELFDNTIDYLMGNPNGAKLNESFRMVQQFGRAVALAWSGLWQVTEYASIAAEYGLVNTFKAVQRDMPGFRGMLKDPANARALNDVLADHSVQSLRIKPFLARFEDGYDMTRGTALQLSLQKANQLVPYANAMKYVHHHQARITGNLILKRVQDAVAGNPDAVQGLEKFGLESRIMETLKADILKHGYNVDAWADSTWDAVRPAFNKMMDAAVLSSRLGDVPAFAQFDTIGKVLFMYRSFVLTAHNKVMAGTVARDGAKALGLLLMFQMPLAMAAVQAQSTMLGEGTLTPKELAAKAVGQMGGLGLFTEPFKVATGQMNSVGASVLIPIDRGIKVLQSGMQGEVGNAASAAMLSTPVVAAMPFVRSISEYVKED